jgi:signal transduction histidine kinase
MEFVAGVSHDLRTPLAVIRSAGDNLAEGVVASPEQVREYGRLIRGEGRRLTGMVEQTLQFAAVQAGKRQYSVQPVAAGELVRLAVEEARPAAEEEGFQIALDLPEGLPLVEADAGAASHCLQNLIGNAVKYGGDARWVGVSAREVGGEVAVTVRDRGPGVDPQELPRIFEPFFRGRRAMEQQIKGSGLGLALARSDAEGFGAKLTVDSAPGEGAAFTLRLPLAKNQETA